jgi:hypothetical protein
MNLSSIVPWGRSFDEYRAMFALSDADLQGRVLGCGDGPASFNAEATAMGARVVSVDPIYAHSAARYESRARSDQVGHLTPPHAHCTSPVCGRGRRALARRVRVARSGPHPAPPD